MKQSVQYDSTLFGQDPTKLKEGCAKWMLDDPRVNFAISTRSVEKGADHLGRQVENPAELTEITERLNKADLGIYAEGDNDDSCCVTDGETDAESSCC